MDRRRNPTWLAGVLVATLLIASCSSSPGAHAGREPGPKRPGTFVSVPLGDLASQEIFLGDNFGGSTTFGGTSVPITRIGARNEHSRVELLDTSTGTLSSTPALPLSIPWVGDLVLMTTTPRWIVAVVYPCPSLPSPDDSSYGCDARSDCARPSRWR